MAKIMLRRHRRLSWRARVGNGRPSLGGGVGESCRPPDVPAWVNFPSEQWDTITPEEAGFDAEKLMK